MKTILFDLDGTLLQMDNDDFLRRYTEVISSYFMRLGYDINKFIPIYNSSFYNMINNKGGISNEEAFYNTFRPYYQVDKLKEDLDSFFYTDFALIKDVARVNSIPSLLIKELKRRGYRLILATNPLFPSICTYQRIKWAGLDPCDFDYISTYENSSYSKPYLNYYLELIKINNLDINNLVMIGNDIDDDFIYLPKEIDKILITDFLINRHNRRVEDYNNMTLASLYNRLIEK